MNGALRRWLDRPVTIGDVVAAGTVIALAIGLGAFYGAAWVLS